MGKGFRGLRVFNVRSFHRDNSRDMGISKDVSGCGGSEFGLGLRAWGLSCKV